MAEFQNPPAAEIQQLLAHSQRIAVVGLSPKTARPSHQISREMQREGYRIIPVRPGVREVLGEPAFKTLLDIPEPVDLVNIFLNPGHLPPVIDACIQTRVPAIWLQSGVIDTAQAIRATDAGIMVVMDRCIHVDYNAMNIFQLRSR